MNIDLESVIECSSCERYEDDDGIVVPIDSIVKTIEFLEEADQAAEKLEKDLMKQHLENFPNCNKKAIEVDHVVRGLDPKKKDGDGDSPVLKEWIGISTWEIRKKLR